MAEVILFVPKGLRHPLFSNLGVFYLVSLIYKDFSVRIIDGSVVKDAARMLLDSLDEKTICVGFSVLTGIQIK